MTAQQTIFELWQEAKKKMSAEQTTEYVKNNWATPTEEEEAFKAFFVGLISGIDIADQARRL